MTTTKEEKQSPSGKKSRAMSGTAYPYFSLEQSIKVALAIHEKGGGICTPDQLASWLGYSAVRNGACMTRFSAARMFGMIASQGEKIALTDRSRAIISPIMPDDAARAKVEAFLDVPLFKAVYDFFKGKTMPQEAGMRNLFENNYKIVKDRVAPAVKVFYDSAEQAGLFSVSGDRSRLIIPLFNNSGAAHFTSADEEETPPSPPVTPPPHAPKNDLALTGIDPALAGLLKKLPSPGPWNATEKEGFFVAFKALFDFLYPIGKDKPDVLR